MYDRNLRASCWPHITAEECFFYYYRSARAVATSLYRARYWWIPHASNAYFTADVRACSNLIIYERFSFFGIRAVRTTVVVLFTNGTVSPTVDVHITARTRFSLANRVRTPAARGMNLVETGFLWKYLTIFVLNTGKSGVREKTVTLKNMTKYSLIAL